MRSNSRPSPYPNSPARPPWNGGSALSVGVSSPIIDERRSIRLSGVQSPAFAEVNDRGSAMTYE